MSVPFPAPYGNPGYSSTPMQMPQQPMYTYRPTSPTPTYPMQSPQPVNTLAGPSVRLIANESEINVSDIAMDGQVRYDMATNACAINNTIQNSARDIIDNQNANYRAIHDELVASQIEAKNEKIAEQQSLIQSLNLAQSQANQNQYLINQLRPCPTPAYITCNPWATNGASYNGCQNFCG